MVVLDTNVLSEVVRHHPLPRVSTWFTNQALANLFICAVTEAELLYGLALLPEGSRRSILAGDIDRLLNSGFAGRILPFDSAAAHEYASIAADRRRVGRPISIPDAQIAAIAKSRSWAVATRNVADFEGCGVTLIDPWTAA
jgi:predicted nucleic acid-binding protein